MFEVTNDTKVILVKNNKIIGAFDNKFDVMQKYDIFLDLVGKKAKGGISIESFFNKITPKSMQSLIDWNDVKFTNLPFIDDYLNEVFTDLREYGSFERGDVKYNGCAIAYYFNVDGVPVCFYTELSYDQKMNEIEDFAIQSKLKQDGIFCFFVPHLV